MFGEDGGNVGGTWKTRAVYNPGLNRDSFVYLGGAICGVGSSPISKRKNLWGVAWTMAWVFS